MNMFSNVSNQVSGLGSSLGSWFKKDGTKGGEEGAEGQEGEVKKDQITPQEQPSPASANASEQSVKGSADENEDGASQHSGKKPSAESQGSAAVVTKSSATEGADSNPASEGEEEPEAKAGFASGLSFNLSAVQGKASAGAKTVGSFFSTAFSKAGASVKEAGSKIKESVEKNVSIVTQVLEQFDGGRGSIVKEI
ncbi:synapse-associated protein of 47 kDa-like isoform X4 [Procambarus clarkii]|uniref:synapse-associated protein of 47 kDa-like isoform X4 n=1 Tax=Procambarus clarkii TaxID=6728 RepID=UPI003743CCE4